MGTESERANSVKFLTQVLVIDFFRLFSKWKWNSNTIERIVYVTSTGLPLVEEFGPSLALAAGSYLMPVVSPLSPYKCTTVNITHSAFVKI